ncbi:MAG: hypothetical protein JWO98_2260 [Frankiales bacterium]|nr:hypothetical protein [Frankiales bacterium]
MTERCFRHARRAIIRGVTFTATTALPYPHLDRATAGLRAELRHQLFKAGDPNRPDWSTLVIEGPEEFADGNGHTWFGYWATVKACQ